MPSENNNTYLPLPQDSTWIKSDACSVDGTTLTYQDSPPTNFLFDIYEAFKEHCAASIELLSHSVVTKDYHVFLYGSVSEDWSYHHEFGRDFDGWLFEIEHFVITRIGG